MKIPIEFFLRTDVVALAQELLGKIIVTEIGGVRTAARITETEAYRAPDDRACHAFGNRRTPRTETMFASGGRAYIYLCYGIHHLFNVVTAPEGMAHAVLVRSVEPCEGIEMMLSRRKKDTLQPKMTTGPGSAAQALGISTQLNGHVFHQKNAAIWLEFPSTSLNSDFEIEVGKRIGVDYAGECAHRLWRFWIKNHPCVSHLPKK